jgi:hypothetical protein
MGLVFAISSLLSVWMAQWFIPHIVHRHYISLPPRAVLSALVFPVLAFTYAMASWTVWKEKRSARAWGVIGCLTYVAINIQMIFYSWRSVPSCVWVMSVIGIAGLVAFTWRDELHDPGQSPTQFADR